MCQTNCSPDGESDCDNSVIQPSENNDLRSKKNGLFMDEALSKTQFGVFNYVLICVSGLSLCAVIAEAGSMAYVIPVLECDMRLSASENGILTGVPFVGMICSSHLWGYLADTKGRRRVIQPTLLLGFLISTASSFVQNFYAFATLRFLNGFFISGCSATIFAYLSEFHDKTHRARAIMMSSIIYGMLCIFLPLIAWGVINQDWEYHIPYINLTYKPWRLYLIVNSLLALIGFLILLFLPESPKFVLGQGKQEKALEILKKINWINNGPDSVLEEFEIYEETESIENRQRILRTKNDRCPILSSIWIQTAPLFKPPHLVSTLLICFIQFCAFFPTGCATFAPLILNNMAANTNDYFNERATMCDAINMNPFQHNETDSSMSMNSEVCNAKLEFRMLLQIVIMEVLFTTGFLLIGVLINKVGKFPIVFVAFVASGVGGVSCMLHDIPILQICGYLLLLLCGIGGNVVSSATVEVYPTSLRGMAVCISLMCARLGGVAGANVAALLLKKHCELVFYLPGTGLIVAGVLTYFIPKIHQKIEEPNIKNDVPLLDLKRHNRN